MQDVSKMTNEELFEELEDCAMASQNLGTILNGSEVFARRQRLRAELLAHLSQGERPAPPSEPEQNHFPDVKKMVGEQGKVLGGNQPREGSEQDAEKR